MSFKEQVEGALTTDGIQEVLKHAHVSLDNNHYCKECICCACIDYLNETRPTIKSIIELKVANNEINHHWFSPDTMKYFGTRIESALVKGRFFITSEQPPHNKRAYAVRIVKKDGRIDTLGKVCQYFTRKDAVKALNEYKRGLN